MSWEDNPYLDKKEIERLSKIMSEDEIESRKYGRFTSIDSGLIYKEFNQSIHVITPFQIPADWQDTLSIDPGLSNPLSCHWYAKDYDGNIYVVAEHYEANQTIEYHSKRIKEISQKLSWKKAPNGMISTLIDSAANQKTLSSKQSVVELFYDEGILCDSNVNKDVLSGISKIKTLLKNTEGDSKLFIFSNCKNMIKEFKTYRWNGYDSPIKKDDHSMDELRYYVMKNTKPTTEKNIKSDIQKNKERLISLLRRT